MNLTFLHLSQTPYSDNSFTHISTPPHTYHQSQWRNQHSSSTETEISKHSQMSPSKQQNTVVAIPTKDDMKPNSALQRQQQRQQQQHHQHQQHQQPQQQNIQVNANIATNGLPSEYHHYRASFEKDVYQSVNRETEKTMADLK